MNLKKRLAKIEKLQTNNHVPWEVLRTGIEPRITGDCVVLTKWSSADPVSLSEARLAVKWLAEELGYIVSESEGEKS